MPSVAWVCSFAALLQKVFTIHGTHRQVLNLPSGHVTVTLFCVNAMQTFTDTLYYPTETHCKRKELFHALGN
jgi:hypothetical protein